MRTSKGLSYFAMLPSYPLYVSSPFRVFGAPNRPQIIRPEGRIDSDRVVVIRAPLMTNTSRVSAPSDRQMVTLGKIYPAHPLKKWKTRKGNGQWIESPLVALADFPYTLPMSTGETRTVYPLALR